MFFVNYPHNLTHYKYRRGYEHYIYPVMEVERTDIEQTSETAYYQHLPKEDGGHNAEEGGTETVGHPAPPARHSHNVANKTAVRAEIAGIEKVPELHHHKEGEEQRQVVLGQLVVVTGNIHPVDS